MPTGHTSLPTLPKTAKKKGVHRREHGYLAVAGVSFLLISFFTHMVAQTERAMRDQEVRNTAVKHAANAARRVEAEIISNIYLANGLATYVASNKDISESDLGSAMHALTGLGKHIRNIGVAVGYRLIYVYPTETNEQAIGLNYPDVADQWPDVKLAVETRSTVLAGPLELAQGGQGIISRTPVFIENDEYWGILSLVLNAGSVFEAAGLSGASEEYRIALRFARDPGDRRVFFGDETVFQHDPTTIEITLPGNRWELGVVPLRGWRADHRLINWAESIVLGLGVGLCVFLFYFLKNRDHLHVREREISAILHTSREGIMVLDAEDKVLEANAAACALFSRDVSEIIGKPVSRIIDFNTPMPESRPELGHMYRNTLEKDAIRATGFCARRGQFPLEIRVGQAESTGRFMLVCALRDISADLSYQRKLIKLATIDPLTYAYNRRSFFLQGENAAKLSQRHGRPLSLLLIDADHFKTINDTFGHAAGDSVLAALGALIRSNVRSTDIFGRIGGEEFALLVPETGREDACVLAEKITRAAELAQVRTGEDEPIRFTVSIGVASSSGSEMDLHALLRMADKALYRAKRAGRNRYAG